VIPPSVPRHDTAGAVAPVLVVGAGPAGLATAALLKRRAIPHRLLERGATLAHSWEHVYDSLILHTGRHMSTLPGRRFPPGTPLFPSRSDFVRYLREYAAAAGLAVETNAHVQLLRRSTHGWMATLHDGRRIEGSAVVVATGIMSNPKVPSVPGLESFEGLVMHSVEYRNPKPFAGQRVLVVGVGNSGGEIGSELARAGVDVTVLVRSGAHVVPLTIGAIPIQYLSVVMRKLPRGAQEWVVGRVQQVTERRRGAPVIPRPAYSPLDAIPLIGFRLADAIREGIVRVQQGTIDHLTASGAMFSDGREAPFDTIIMATGFAPALGMLGDLVTRDERGFARRRDRVASSDQPGLYFVGHNYDATGGLANIKRDARLVARELARCGRRRVAMAASRRADERLRQQATSRH